MYRNMRVIHRSAKYGITGGVFTGRRGTSVISYHGSRDCSSANDDASVDKSVDWSVAVDNQQADEDIMHISGAGHWFLEGWIGEDSGSAVTAVSHSFV